VAPNQTAVSLYIDVYNDIGKEITQSLDENDFSSALVALRLLQYFETIIASPFAIETNGSKRGLEEYFQAVSDKAKSFCDTCMQVVKTVFDSDAVLSPSTFVDFQTFYEAIFAASTSVHLPELVKLGLSDLCLALKTVDEECNRCLESKIRFFQVINPILNREIERNPKSGFSIDVYRKGNLYYIGKPGSEERRLVLPYHFIYFPHYRITFLTLNEQL